MVDWSEYNLHTVSQIPGNSVVATGRTRWWRQEGRGDGDRKDTVVATRRTPNFDLLQQSLPVNQGAKSMAPYRNIYSGS